MCTELEYPKPPSPARRLGSVPCDFYGFSTSFPSFSYTFICFLHFYIDFHIFRVKNFGFYCMLGPPGVYVLFLTPHARRNLCPGTSCPPTLPSLPWVPFPAPWLRPERILMWRFYHDRSRNIEYDQNTPPHSRAATTQASGRAKNGCEIGGLSPDYKGPRTEVLIKAQAREGGTTTWRSPRNEKKKHMSKFFFVSGAPPRGGATLPCLGLYQNLGARALIIRT